MVDKMKKKIKTIRPKYFIRTQICTVITGSTLLTLMVGTGTTIVFILYYRLLQWIDQIITTSILLNIHIMS